MVTNETEPKGPAMPGVRSIRAGWRTLFQIALAALGLTELCCFFLVAPLLHPRHAAVYHWSGSASGLFVPVFLDLLVVWVVIVTLLRCVHTRRLPRMMVWLGFLLCTPAILSYEWDLMFNGTASSLTLRLSACSLLGGAVLALGWRFFARALSRVVEFASTVMIFFGLGSGLLLAQLASLGWQARGLNRLPALQGQQETPVAAASGGRIVWIVFDELSYQQVYERRYRGLALPAFDGLAAEASVLTQAAPAGIFTDLVLPSLMSGRKVDRVRSSPGGALWTHDPDRDQWQAFDAHDTVFADARRSGYRTAVAGWYIPYCRILPGVLDGCFWSYDIPLKNRMASRQGLLRTMLAPFLSAGTGWMPERWLAGEPRLQALRTYGTARHIADFEHISDAADALLRNPADGFVLLHFPVPHPGGIYDRRTGQFSTGPSTYLDNLALADRCLAHVREVLEQTGQWDASTVVVMGDHSWRMGQMMPDAAPLQGEEMEASQGGRYDPRPVYVVKLAGQRKGQQVNAPFSAVNTRALLDAILRGEVRTPEDLEGEVRKLP